MYVMPPGSAPPSAPFSADGYARFASVPRGAICAVAAVLTSIINHAARSRDTLENNKNYTRVRVYGSVDSVQRQLSDARSVYAGLRR